MFNVICFGWKRPLPGRERLSEKHFQDYVEYLGGLQKKGEIQSFEACFLSPNGGQLDGFFLIKGDPHKLDAICGSDEWIKHMLRAGMHLDGQIVARGVTGDALMKQFGMWAQAIPG